MSLEDEAMWRENTRAQCEQYGESRVRQLLATKSYQARKAFCAQEWLEEREAAAAEAQREIDRGLVRAANRTAFWVGVSGNIIALLALTLAAYAAFWS